MRTLRRGGTLAGVLVGAKVNVSYQLLCWATAKLRSPYKEYGSHNFLCPFLTGTVHSLDTIFRFTHKSSQ